jgi:hypothetical protein
MLTTTSSSGRGYFRGRPRFRLIGTPSTKGAGAGKGTDLGFDNFVLGFGVFRRVSIALKTGLSLTVSFSERRELTRDPDNGKRLSFP